MPADHADEGAGESMFEGIVPAAKLEDLPLLSFGTFEALREEVDGSPAFDGFIDRYMSLWPVRHSRLVDACHNHDHEAAMDAILSIRSSAQMIGALRLAAHTLESESVLRSRESRTGKTMLTALDACGQATMIQLRCQRGAGDESTR